jgi:hypothetical protein
VGGAFDILEVPGIAVIVHPHSAATRSNSGEDEIHVGFVSGDCAASGAGDYSFINLGSPTQTAKTDMFGMYRQNDNNFSSVTHADFGASMSSNTFTTIYGGNSTTNGTETISTVCANGVRAINLGGG